MRPRKDPETARLEARIPVQVYDTMLRAAELRGMTRRFWIAAALSLPVFLLSMLPMLGVPVDRWLGQSADRWLQLVLATPVMAADAAGRPQSIHALWNRRHTTKFNGVAYPTTTVDPKAYRYRILNAADEIAVEAFLNGRIGFTGIARTVRATLEQMPHTEPRTIGEVLAVDVEARATAREIVEKSPVTVGAGR